MAYRLSSFFAAVFVFIQIAGAADLSPHNIVAHGTANQFWIAHVELTSGPVNSVRSTIYSRQLGQDGKWEALTSTPLPARVVSLANQDGVAAALLDDGNWSLLYADTGPFTAGALPKPARMVAIAGGASAWWAVGVVPGGLAALPATRAAVPTSSRAAAPMATQAASQPASARLVLFTLIGNDWRPRAEFPDPVGAPPVVSLMMIDDTAYIADAVPDGVRISHFEKDNWVTDATFTGLPRLAGFKLLSTSHVPRLWIEPMSGPDLIYSLNAHEPVELAETFSASPADRTIAVATGKLRVLAIVKDQIVEQDYDVSNLHPDDGVSPVPLPHASPIAQLQQFQMWLVLIALVLAVMGSFRQRAMMRGAGIKAESFSPAPLGRRFAAGVIDLAPFAIVALAFGLIHFNAGKAATDPNRSAILMLLYWCAAIVYIVSLTILEALAGRSPGKWLMNLRIIGMDGKPADTGSLITRNLLRVIDVGIAFLPLLMVVFMPLRQRAGDVAAGTLVVRGDVRPEPETTEEVSATTSNATTPEQS